MKEQFAINALIIDDDEFSREQLSDLLAKHAKNVKLLERCDNATSGIAAINRLKPDLVFLDIEMPDMTGFEMLKQLPALSPEIIFITAFDKYAIKAIRFAALDYILKPVKWKLLQEALNRAEVRINARKFPPEYKYLLGVLMDKEKELERIAIPTMEGLVFVALSNIIRCESEDRYTRIYLADKKMIFASRTLGDFEELLQTNGFVRIHKSHLINISHLAKYLRGEGGQVIMTDGSTLDVSRRKKDDLLKMVSKFR